MWTVNDREVIVLGDRTTHGGKVITACEGMLYNGIPVARVGDEVSCPKCSGKHTIVTGSPIHSINGKATARNLDSVSCGALLIAGSGSIAVSAGILDIIEWLLRKIFGDPYPYYPGKGLPKEEVCKVARAILSHPKVKEGLAEMLRLTNENKWEYHAYIVENSPGEYELVYIRTDKERLSVTPGPVPPNAVADIHTHPNATLGKPSPDDRDYIRSQKQKVMVYFVMGASGDIGYQNDEGDTIAC